MPIRTDLNTEAIHAQFSARKPAARRTGGHRMADGSTARPTSTEAAGIRPGAKTGTAGFRSTGTDSVEISLAVNMRAEAANGIVMDSVIEQINKAIQEAGIDLTVIETKISGMDLSPEATARRIVDFATGFLDGYEANHAYDPARMRISGFMSLIRGAIREGFQQARHVLEKVTKLSEQIDDSINRTYELANRYLDEFQHARIDPVHASPNVPEEG